MSKLIALAAAVAAAAALARRRHSAKANADLWREATAGPR